MQFDLELNLTNLRPCQKNALDAIHSHYSNKLYERNIIVQLPTGSGKSVLIATIPFNLSKTKVLLVTPNLNISKQLELDLDFTRSNNVYKKYEVLKEGHAPFYVLNLDKSISKNDIQEHHILIANYHQLYDLNRWFNYGEDVVDLIIIDEAHHQEADTYQNILNHFPNAKIIGLTATPFRSDGKTIEGKVIYTYSFAQAIKDNVIRNISSCNVSQEAIELRFSDNKNKEYSLKQILDMKEQSWFNQGIALSSDCCDSIASTSLDKLNDLNMEYPMESHQIIAVAMNKRHAREFVKPSFEKLGLKVGIVSSDEQDKKHNEETLAKLTKGKIDVIITIGMLGEGFNHPPLSIAAIFRPFKTLNPYMQFLGRVVRKNGTTNKSYVVSHVGLNQTTRFSEFKLFDTNEQKLLKSILDEVDGTYTENVISSFTHNDSIHCQILDKGQHTISLNEEFTKLNNELYSEDHYVNQHREIIDEFGVNVSEDTLLSKKKNRQCKPVDQRKADRKLLNEKEKSITKDILQRLGLEFSTKTFTSRYKDFVWVKQKVSRFVNNVLGIKRDERLNVTKEQFDRLYQDNILDHIKNECYEYFFKKLNEIKSK